MDPIKLPSGAELKITLSPFVISRDLYQAMLEELKVIKLDMEADVDGNFFKDIFCAGFSSKRVEKCIWKCMEKALYNDLRITEDTFESEAARDDYFAVMFEVAKANVMPFTKNLSVQYGHILDLLKKPQS